MSEAEIEKRRNKLGYQRISIACGKFFVDGLGLRSHRVPRWHVPTRPPSADTL